MANGLSAKLLFAGLTLSCLAMPAAARADEAEGASRGTASGSPRNRIQARPAAATSGKAPAEQRTLTHAGKTRTAIVHVPKRARDEKTNEPLPLMIVLHGFLADGEMTRILSGFNGVADRHHFIVAYPDGLGRMWRFWEGTGHVPALQAQVGKQIGAVDDPGFLLHLVDDLVAEKLVDPRRVYMTGISNGGFMTNRMAWEYGDRIAAIAPVAGTIPSLMLPDIKPVRPMPTLIAHGTEDRIVDYAGSDKFGIAGKFISAPQLAEWWATKNRCLPEETKTLPDKTNDGTIVREHRFAAAAKEGPASAEVRLYEIEGGGHTWPGGSFQPRVMLGETCHDWSASEAIWEFCSRYSLPEIKKP